MRRARQREDGTALVEFALVLPILVIFLYGIVQFGIVYDKQQAINSAAREGSRLGSLELTTMAEISARAIAASDASAAAGEDPTITVYAGPDATPTGIRDSSGVYTVNGTSTHPNPKPSREDDETLMPCGRDTPADYVRVIVSTPYDITIPLFGVMNVTVDAEAEFRCE